MADEGAERVNTAVTRVNNLFRAEGCPKSLSRVASSTITVPRDFYDIHALKSVFFEAVLE